MLMATTNKLEDETKRDLERLLTALNALPSAWADYGMVNALTVQPSDVVQPRVSDELVLMPSPAWITAEGTWMEAIVELNIDKPFALNTTIANAKNRIVEVLNMAAGKTVTAAPLPPTAPTPTLPVQPLTTVSPAPANDWELLDPYTPELEPTVVTPTPTLTSLSPSPLLKNRSWPYWAAGGVGFAALIGVGLLARRTPNSASDTGLRGRKIVGTFCEEALAPRRDFDSRSFRWKRTGSSWLLTGCPKNAWNSTEQWCRVGTRGYRLLTPTSTRKRCPTGSQRITK